MVLDNNIKLYVKVDQAYMCNLQPWFTIFSELYFILRFALCRYIYNVTYITCITYKYIYYFVTCEMSDVTKSSTSMNVVCSN